jgi:hypothetical protein
MGYDKFVSFLSKNLSNKCYEDIFPIENVEGSVIAKYIFYDINFIIYKCINNIENNINEIIKVFNCIENKKEIKIKKYLKNCLLKKYINFNFIINEKNSLKRIFILKQKIDKVINNIIYDEILKYILFSLYSIHKPYFIKNVLIFFDGIPGYSKILEQRKRRLYNYINSINRKKYYNEHFSNKFNFIEHDKNIDIKYNYFDYITNTYSINKNFGPQSDFLYLLSIFLKNNLLKESKIKVIINNGIVPGEADYKILKYIEKNKLKGDICIHSCDSDFLYFIILNQLKNENDYVNLNLIKYSNNSYQLYNGKNLINLFSLKYKLENKLSYNINLNFLYDILFIIQMFGNDLIPDNFEISADINLSIFLKCHYELYKSSNFIININNDKTINFNNLLIFLNNLNKYNLFTINLLSKFFKIPKKLIYIICHELKFNIKDFINNIIIPYLKYEAFLFKETIDIDDIRYKYINNFIEKNPIDDLNLCVESKKYLNENLKYIFDYMNENDYGLIRLTINYNICNNPYESLYNSIVTNSIIETNNKINTSFKFKNLKNAQEEYNNFTKNIDVYNYFEIIENQSQILFYDLNIFDPTNKIYCKSNTSPSIKNIIEYLKYNNYYTTTKKKFSKIYFNTTSHHLFITPYLLSNLNFLNKDQEFLPNIMNIMNYIIKNIFSIDEINLRDIDPDIFLNNITQLINLFNQEKIRLLYLKKNILI